MNNTQEIKDEENLNQSFSNMKEKFSKLPKFQSEPMLNEQQNKILALITIDIGEKTEIVKILEGDDVRKIAIGITEKNNLSEEAVDYLIENINMQIKANNEKPQFFHNKKHSIDESQEINLNNKSLAEMQYENWQKILQQKTNLKNMSNQQQHFKKQNDFGSYRSTPQLNNSREFRSQTPSIYEKLYQAALNSQNKKEEKSRVSIEERIKRDRNESTFRPKTNSHYQNKTKNTSVSPIRTGKEVSEHLYKEGKKYLENKKKREKVKEELELEKCPFKPEINKTSKTLLEEKSRNKYKSIHDKLYKGGKEEEIKREKWRKVHFDLYYPFQPNIDKEKSSLSLIKKEDRSEFIERLVNSRKIQEQNNTHLKIKNSVEIDKKTGQALFHPVITKDKYYYSAKSKENEEYNEVKSELLRYMENKNNSAFVKKDLNKSKKPKENLDMINDPFLKALKEIFDLMDDDKDKWISSKKIDISEIDPYFLEIIQEILIEMEDKKEKLDFNLFYARIKEFNLERKVFEVFS